jgi:hypothetical protein
VLKCGGSSNQSGKEKKRKEKSGNKPSQNRFIPIYLSSLKIGFGFVEID